VVCSGSECVLFWAAVAVAVALAVDLLHAEQTCSDDDAGEEADAAADASPTVHTFAWLGLLGELRAASSSSESPPISLLLHP